MTRTLPHSSRRRAGAVLAILIHFLVITIPAHGGENISDKAVSPANEAYRQALREAERELPGQEARMGGGDGWSVSAILSIIALGLAAGMAAWLTRRLRRYGWTAAGGKEMRILDSLPLGRQSTLFLVQVRGRHYWLADHPHGVALLGECPPPGDHPPPSPAQGNAMPPEKRA